MTHRRLTPRDRKWLAYKLTYRAIRYGLPGTEALSLNAMRRRFVRSVERARVRKPTP